MYGSKLCVLCHYLSEIMSNKCLFGGKGLKSKNFGILTATFMKYSQVSDAFQVHLNWFITKIFKVKEGYLTKVPHGFPV